MPKLPSNPKNCDSDSSGDELHLRRTVKKRKRKQNEQVTRSPKKKKVGLKANEKEVIKASKTDYTNGNAELSSCTSEEESVSPSKKKKNSSEMGFLNCEIDNNGQTNVTRGSKNKILRTGSGNSTYMKKQVNKDAISKGVLAFYPENDKFPEHPASYKVIKASEFLKMYRLLSFNENSPGAIGSPIKTPLHKSPAKTRSPSVNQNSPENINLNILHGEEIEDASDISKITVASFSPSKSTEEHYCLDKHGFNPVVEVEKSTKPICDTNPFSEKAEGSHKQRDSNEYIKNNFRKANNQNLDDNTNIIETSPQTTKIPNLNKPESSSKNKQNRRSSKDISQNCLSQLNSKDFVSKEKTPDNLLVTVGSETPSRTVSSPNNVSNVLKWHKKDESKGKNVTSKNQHSKIRPNNISKESIVVDINSNSPSQSPVHELRKECRGYSEKTNESFNEKETFHERSALQKNSKKIKIHSLKESNKSGKSSSNDFNDDELSIEAVIFKDDVIDLPIEDCVLSPRKSPSSPRKSPLSPQKSPSSPRKSPRKSPKAARKSSEHSEMSPSKSFDNLLNFAFSDSAEFEYLDFEDVEKGYKNSLCANSNSAKKITPECPKINGIYADQFDSETINFSALPAEDSEADLNSHLTEGEIVANVADENRDIELTTSNSDHVNVNSNEFNSVAEHDKVCNRSESNEILTTIECNMANDIPENNETAVNDNKKEDNNCESDELITASVECDEREDEKKDNDLSTTVKSKNETYVFDRVTNSKVASSHHRHHNKFVYHETDISDSEQSCVEEYPSHSIPNTTPDQNDIHKRDRKSYSLDRYNNAEGRDEASESELSDEEGDDAQIPAFHRRMAHKGKDPVFKIPLKTVRKKQPKPEPEPVHNIFEHGFKIYASQDELEVETDMELNKQDQFSVENYRNFSDEEVHVEVEHGSGSSGEKNTHDTNVNVNRSYKSKSIEEKNRARSGSRSPTVSPSQASREQVRTPRLPPVSLKAYCSSFLKTGSCSQKCCKYLHKVPDYILPKPTEVTTARSLNFAADPRKVINDFSQVMADIKEACESKHLKKAIDESKSLLERKPPVDVKDKAVKMLLDAAAGLEDESHMFEIFQKILKAYRLLNTKHCSDFIKACKAKPTKTLPVILEMFDFCRNRKIPLRSDGLEALHVIFCLDRSQWTLTLRLMLYKNEVCKHRYDIKELNEALSVCVHCSQTRTDTEQNLKLLSRILDALYDEEFLKLHPETVKSFILLLKQYHFDQEGYRNIERKANKWFGSSPVQFPEHVNQLPFNIIPPVNVNRSVSVLNRISSAVDGNDWNAVVQTFRSCTERKDYESFHHLQLQLLCKESAMCQCFASFLGALTSDSYSTHELTLDEKFLVGQLGVALVHETYANRRFADSYAILSMLHDYNINYFELQLSGYSELAPSPVQSVILGPWDVFLVAVEICLRNEVPLNALKIVSMFHKKELDTRTNPEKRNKIIRRRVELLTKLTRILLKRKEGLDLCREALNYLIDFSKGCRNILLEKSLEDIKNIFNWYFVESLNSKCLDKVEELIERMTSMNMDLYADINHVIFRGLLVQYYNTGQVKKAEDLYKKCCFYGVYQIALPNVLSQSREIILSTEWTISELRAFLDSALKKFCEMLNPRNKKYSFEEWFSLTFKFVEPKPSNDVPLQVHGIYNISATFHGFSTRLTKVLNDIGLVTKEAAMDHFKIEPESVYELCTLWKNTNASKNASSLSEVAAFNWNKGNMDSTFGGKSFSDSKSKSIESEPTVLKSSTPKHAETNAGPNLSPSPISKVSPKTGPLSNKFKRIYGKELTSGKFACDRAKTSGLKISLNSSGREITSEKSIPSKNSSSGDEGKTRKCVSPNKSSRASLPESMYSNEVNDHCIVKDPKYNWVRPNFENNLHSRSYHNQQISPINTSASAGTSSDPDEQTASQNAFASIRSDRAEISFRKKASDSAFLSPEKAPLKTSQFRKPIRWETNRPQHDGKYVCHKHRNNHSKNSNSLSADISSIKNSNSLSADISSIKDSTKSSINKLRDSVLILVNQKHGSMSDSEKEQLVTDILENFLAEYKFTEQQLSQKQSMVTLVNFVKKNL